MKEKIEEIYIKAIYNDVAPNIFADEILSLFSQNNIIRRSECCNAILDTDEQSCYICSSCGDRI